MNARTPCIIKINPVEANAMAWIVNGSTRSVQIVARHPRQARGWNAAFLLPARISPQRKIITGVSVTPKEVGNPNVKRDMYRFRGDGTNGLHIAANETRSPNH